MTSKYLGIYLNDHLGGSTVGLELVQRIAKQYAGSDLGSFAEELVAEIRDDRDTLLEIMRLLDVSTDQAKVAIGWISEKFGRLKPNGELRGDSPLSPVVELEGLSLGIEGKRAMWQLLAETDETAQRIGREQLQGLIARAEDQRERVERHRRAAAAAAFTA